MYVRVDLDLLRGHNLSLSAKTVYALVVFRTGGNGCCWPTLKGMAADLEVSTETITRSIKALEKSGLIRVERHHRRSAHYFPILPTSAANCVTVPQKAVPQNAALSAAKSGTSDAKSGATVPQKAVPKLTSNTNKKTTTKENSVVESYPDLPNKQNPQPLDLTHMTDAQLRDATRQHEITQLLRTAGVSKPTRETIAANPLATREFVEPIVTRCLNAQVGAGAIVQAIRAELEGAALRKAAAERERAARDKAANEPKPWWPPGCSTIQQAQTWTRQHAAEA